MTVNGAAILPLLWNRSWDRNANQADSNKVRAVGFGRLAGLLAVAVVLVNVVLTFVECGPCQCPDNPVDYWMLQD